MSCGNWEQYVVLTTVLFTINIDIIKFTLHMYCCNVILIRLVLYKSIHNNVADKYGTIQKNVEYLHCVILLGLSNLSYNWYCTRVSSPFVWNCSLCSSDYNPSLMFSSPRLLSSTKLYIVIFYMYLCNFSSILVLL